MRPNHLSLDNAIANGVSIDSDDTFHFKTITGQTIDGGSGYDIIDVSKAANIDFGTDGTKLIGIEELDLSNAADTIVFAKGVDKGAEGDVLVLNTNGGADFVDASVLGKLHLDANLGSGQDTLTVGAHSLVGDTYDGGAGKDTIDVVGGGNVDLNNATIANFEQVQVDGHATTLTMLDNQHLAVNAGTSAGTIIIAGNYGDDITLGTAGQTVEDFNGNSTVYSTIDNLYNGVRASTILGDGGTTLSLKGGGDFDPQNFTLSGVDSLIFDNNHYNIDLTSSSDSFDITLGNGDDNLITGTEDYTITGGRNGQTVDMSQAYYASFISNGNGVDNVTGGYDDHFTAILGGGNDTYTISGISGGSAPIHQDSVDSSFTIDALLNGGAGFDTLLISTPGSADITMGTSIVGFESVDLSGSQGDITLTTNNQIFDVVGSSFNDYVYINNVGQSVHSGAGNDTVEVDNQTVGSNFVYDGGTGHDQLDLYAAGTDTLGVGVTNIEDIYASSGEGGGGAISVVLAGGQGATADGNLEVDLEGGGNSLYAGAGTGIYVTLDEGNNFVDLQGASNTEVFSFGGSLGDTVRMGTGTAIDIQLSSSDDTVQINSQAQISAYDGVPDYNTINGGGGTDTLEFTAAGTYDLNLTLGLSGFEDVKIDNGNVVNLTLDNAGYTVAMGDQAGTSVTGGNGNDTFDFGANGQTAAGGNGNDTYVVTGSELTHETYTELAGGGTDTLEITTGGTFTLSTGANNNIENFVLDAASNVTDGLTTTSDPTGYSLLGSAGDDTITITTAQLFSGVAIGGGGHVLGDTIDLSGGGTFDFTAAGVSISGIANVNTGTTSNSLVLDGDGYHVGIDGSVHAITAGAGADYFDFTGNGSYNGVGDTITGFASGPGAGHDTLDLTTFGLTGYDGAVADDQAALADLTTAHHHAVFSTATHTLFVDANGDGQADLQIHFDAGVTGFTQGNDLII